MADKNSWSEIWSSDQKPAISFTHAGIVDVWAAEKETNDTANANIIRPKMIFCFNKLL